MKNGRIKIEKKLAGGLLMNPVSRTIITKVAKKVPKIIKNRKEIIGKMGKEITDGMKKIYSKKGTKKLKKDIDKSNKSFTEYLKRKKN